MATRSPIIAVLGHVDHGKSSILDKIRNSCIVENEAGAITQAIGASAVPAEVIKNFCSTLKVKMEMTIPGLLFIDTPGHEAFTSLRKRGGNLADIAVLVVDINEGFKPQTIEALEILKSFKTPFVIVLNKIDLIDGFKVFDDLKNKSLIENLNAQTPELQAKIEEKLYSIVAFINEKFGLNSDRFDRVDFTKQIAIIPCSAKQGIGIPELLMILTGLTQKFLEEKLKSDISPNAKAKGTILEVKTVEGLGLCIDAILYDGIIRTNDILIIAGLEKPIITKVRGLFEPRKLSDMRDQKTKFQSMKQVIAASGVRIAAPNIDEVIAGMPFISIIDPKQLEESINELQKEVSDIMIETEKEGIIVKADTIGSLEALIKLLKDKGIKIRKATIGNITKKDITDAESNYEKEPLDSVILGFNVEVEKDIKNEKVKIITSNIIYKIIEEYEKWKIDESRRIEERILEGLTTPCKIEYLHNYTFRQSNPAVIGVEILIGKIKSGMNIMNKEGEILTNIKEIQKNKETVNIAIKKEQVAISLPGITVGRQINEGDIFYSAIPENEFRELKKLTKYMEKDEVQLLKEIADIMRRKNPVWGI
ncbi:MAG: translation initiation factor aIF-2 [Candidatus Woesearchaeota archaeon]|nr:MAG: translation initiation factor aIF-2 [Candidatus Woesearchaeota archaeon]